MTQKKQNDSRLKLLFKKLGPGFITGAADDDPSGIATYSQTGAQFGYTQLWTALFSFPFMVVIQEMCGRIGIVVGQGLATITRRHYPKSVLYFTVTLLLIANTINIGADLGAMAAVIRLFIPLPFAALLIMMTILTILLEVFVSYPKYSRFLKYLTFSLFAYIAVAFLIHPDWQAIGIAALMPTIIFSKAYLLNIVAILGTTISPYLFFWEVDEEVEEEISRGQFNGTKNLPTPEVNRVIKGMRIDTIFGMFFSNLIMFFVIAAAAATLHANGITHIETADQAALAFRPFGGEFGFILFALGILGTGLLAVPILAGSAAYAVAESVGWKAGLFLDLKQAHGFYGVITIATLAGLLVNFLGIPPFQVLYYTAVANGFAAPPLIILILLICNNKRIMGTHTNSRWSNIGGSLIAGIMTICLILLMFSVFVK